MFAGSFVSGFEYGGVSGASLGLVFAGTEVFVGVCYLAGDVSDVE